MVGLRGDGHLATAACNGYRIVYLELRFRVRSGLGQSRNLFLCYANIVLCDFLGILLGYSAF